MQRLFGLLISSIVAFALPYSNGHAAGGKNLPSAEPIPRIETGMHTTFIRRVAADRRCTILATASDDKTVRLWSVNPDQLIRTIRLPIGDGHGGKFFAISMSPDGRLVAAGGWDAEFNINRTSGLFIIDTITGNILHRLTDATSTINELAFSPDGSFLVAMLSGAGMMVWETREWQVAGRDPDYKGDSYGAVFDRNGRLYTNSFDGHLRQYAPETFKLERKVKLKSGRLGFGLSLDPQGQNLAVGYNDVPKVDVYDAKSLKHKFSPDVTGLNNNALLAVSWSNDGERLYAGGTYWNSGSRRLIIWEKSGRSKLKSVEGPNQTIYQLAPCRNRMAITSGDPSFGILSQDGKREVWFGSVVANLGGKLGKHFTVSEDGMRIRFGLGYQSQNPVLFDLAKGQLIDAPRPVSDLYEPDTGTLPLTNWNYSSTPKLGSKVIKLDRNEKSYSVAIRLDGNGFVLSGSHTLRLYDEKGAQLWKKSAPSTPWGVNITANDKLIIAALGDGTIRWYRSSDGRELLALFINAKDKRWVAWTPKGYYTASPGGEDLLGWHINRDWDQIADFFPISRFRERFYRPDVVELVLKLFDENRAIRRANRLAQRKDNEGDLLQRLPPVINIIGPGNNSEFNKKEVNLEYSLRSPSGLDVSRIDVLIDGRPLPDVQLANLSVPKSGKSGKITIPLPDRDVQVALIARTAKAASEPAKLSLKWKGAPPKPKTPEFAKPKLYALLIGVSDYQNADYRLRYAAKDAVDVSKALSNQAGGVYREVVTKVLTDKDATAGNIRDGLEWLEQEVTHRDVGLLFLAGHGITDRKQRFYYLPFDGDPKKLRRTAIPQTDIQDAISSLPGKVLMFIDACHSARGLSNTTQTRGLSLLDVTAVVNELSSAENGVVMFASSTGRQLSIEDDRWQNGAFTEALLEGLDGKADYSKDSVVSVGELDLWLSERVKSLTNKQQHPVARRPDTVPDFPFAIRK